MSYATIDDLKKQLPEDMLVQLTDDAGAGAIDAVVADNALETAAVEIDGYLAGRYTLPLSPVPAVVVKLAVDIAVYNLYARRGGPPEHWQKRYDNTIRFLERIGDGRIGLGADDPTEGSSDAEAVVPVRLFSRGSMGGL
jgi:phage gp36-like protein